ncbi:MAG: hypothetical protein IJH34_10845, partial [Romboutsia sp.]|nr:hypothetical protein [Romboutsia sp.]
VTSMNGNVYFMRGIDIYGQGYGVYYNIGTKKIVKEMNSGTEFINAKEVDKAIKDIEEYLKAIQDEEDNKSIEDKLDSVEIY